MLCEKCGKNQAVVFYRESVNGKEKSLSLCEHCAAEAERSGEIEKLDFSQGFWSDPFKDMNSIFGTLFGVPQYQKKQLGEAKKCPLCGATFQDLVSEGKAGCPECYKTFADELSGTIGRIHGATSHTGSAPGKFRAGRERRREISSLEHELKSAVSDENYERAAEIRDRLRELRGESGKDGE